MTSQLLMMPNMTLRSSHKHSKLRACVRQSVRTHTIQMSVVARHPKPKANRSRTGCEQCKARKVKCDEQKPSCKRCVAGSKECVYIAPKVWLFEPGRDTGLITGEELYRIPFKPNEASECQNSVCRSRARTNKGDEQHTCQGPLCHARLVGHVQVDAMGQRALNFFINSYAPSYGAIVTLKDGTNGLLTRLLPWALSEDTILETLIAIALATAAEGKLNTDDGRGALMYRQSIISKIMQRLPHGCDHVTLQAVICLIFTDMRLGLIDHCRAHLQGLRAMVVICGGLQSLGCDGMQRDIILLLDEVFHIFDHDEYPDFPGPYPQQPLLTRFSSFAPEIGAQIFGLKSVPLRFRQQDLFPWLREPIVL